MISVLQTQSQFHITQTVSTQAIMMVQTYAETVVRTKNKPHMCIYIDPNVTCQIHWRWTERIRIWNAIKAKLAVAVQSPALHTATCGCDTGVVVP